MNEEELITSGPEEPEALESAPEAEATPEPSPTASPELEEISQRLERIDSTLGHPLLSTPLEDYTVTEGLLLGLLIVVLAVAVINLVRRAFTWL